MIFENFITVISLILILRCSLIMAYRILNNHFKTFNKKGSFLNKYINAKKDNPWPYRLFGLSALWLIIKYWSYIKDIKIN